MKKVYKKLELDAILTSVAAHAVSDVAKRQIINTEPSNDIAAVRRLLEETSEACRNISVYNIIPEFSFDSVAVIADKAKILSTLSMAELLCVMRLLRVSRLVMSALTSVNDESITILPCMARGIFCDRKLEDDIDFAILSEDMMNDRASSHLYSIRQSIKRANEEVKNKLQQYIKSAQYQKYLQDAIITVREDRYVIPVKQEYRGYIKGLVHDVSGSGATLFVEPVEIVNLNNQIKILLKEEAAEIDRILREFTVRVGEISGALVENEEIVASLDAIYARAHYADEIRGTVPKINARGYINIKKGRHPLIDKNKVVPVSISLGKTFDILVVTGPNTGGKTVSLKSVGLFVLMAGCGLFLPCEEESEISLFDEIYCDIGDEQSIEQSHSTFSGHVTNIADILKNITPNSLILFDELGAGTEPNEGAALALAITEYILSVKAKAIITTHYTQLKEFSLVTDRVENASMEFDLTTFAPTYKLVVGVPGSSNAIQIAKRLGIGDDIIENAKSKLSAEKISFENVLQRAEKLRQQYENTNEEIAEIKSSLAKELEAAKNQNKILASEREQLLKNSKAEAKRIVQETTEESKRLLDELKKIIRRYNADESILFELRSKIKKFGDKKYENDENIPNFSRPIEFDSIKVGDYVFVKKLNATGKVLSKNESKKKLEVAVGAMKISASANDLAEALKTAEDIGQTKTVSVKTNIAAKTLTNEINLIGQTVDEALVNLDAFIDSCLVASINEIRIIHGRGTGALMKGVQDHLKKHAHVAEFRLGAYGEGDRGVTIAKLK
mgnify:FL=1